MDGREYSSSVVAPKSFFFYFQAFRQKCELFNVGLHLVFCSKTLSCDICSSTRSSIGSVQETMKAKPFKGIKQIFLAREMA
jgi:hypothetical protein